MMPTSKEVEQVAALINLDVCQEHYLRQFAAILRQTTEGTDALVKDVPITADNYQAVLKLCRTYEKMCKQSDAENARLKKALDKYSEDEMLLIERCAKVCEGMWVGHGISQQAALCCAAAIRALKEEK
jgi:hypothetical protein